MAKKDCPGLRELAPVATASPKTGKRNLGQFFWTYLYMKLITERVNRAPVNGCHFIPTDSYSNSPYQ